MSLPSTALTVRVYSVRVTSLGVVGGLKGAIKVEKIPCKCVRKQRAASRDEQTGAEELEQPTVLHSLSVKLYSVVE